MSATAQSAFSSSAGRVMNWARQGVESFVAVQKILMDLAAQQNALAIRAMRERIRIPCVRTMAVNAAEQGIEALTGAGGILLDLAAGETAIVTEGMKEALRLPPVPAAAAEIVRQRLESVIGLQRRLLDSIAEQSKDAANSYADGKGLNVIGHSVDVARTALEDFVSTERKFLDAVAREVTAAVEPAKESHKPRPRVKVLTELARDGVDKYVDAQKKLTELLIQQVERNAAASKGEETEPPTPFSELAQKSVHNFVSAQKSLIDLAVKPVAAKQSTAHASSPRPRRRTAAKRAAS